MYSSEAEMKQSLKAQLEYYFSVENLSTDYFLRSKMDTDKSIPITCIAEFPRVRAHTNSLAIVTSILKSIKSVVVSQDSLRVRPVEVPNASLILTLIPPHITADDIMQLFDDAPLIKSKIAKVKSFNVQNWSLGFSSEESCAIALRHVQRKKISGLPIICYIQSITPIKTELLETDKDKKKKNLNTLSKKGSRSQSVVNAEFPPLESNSSPSTGVGSVANTTSVSTNVSKTDENQQPLVQKPNFIQYPREKMAEIVKHFNNGDDIIEIPSEYDRLRSMEQYSGIFVAKPITHTSLLDPIPIFFPASPSPETAFRIPDANVNVPFLDLNSGSSPDNSTMPLPSLSSMSTLPDLSSLNMIGGLSDLSTMSSIPSFTASTSATPATYLNVQPISNLSVISSLPASVQHPKTITSATTKNDQREQKLRKTEKTSKIDRTTKTTSRRDSATTKASNVGNNRSGKRDSKVSGQQGTRHIEMAKPALFPKVVPNVNGYAQYQAMQAVKKSLWNGPSFAAVLSKATNTIPSASTVHIAGKSATAATTIDNNSKQNEKEKNIVITKATTPSVSTSHNITKTSAQVTLSNVTTTQASTTTPKTIVSSPSVSKTWASLVSNKSS